MISRELAQRLIDQVSAHTDYNINIMDENGIIIASRDSERIGCYHEIAARIAAGKDAPLETDGVLYPGVLPGINMVLRDGEQAAGVVGVTGKPDEIRPVAMIVKMALETMLKYERSQEQLRLRANRMESFVYLLTHAKEGDRARLKILAEDLGFSEKPVRIPLLLISKGQADSLLPRLRELPGHLPGLDICAATGEHRLLIFKALPGKRDRLHLIAKDYLTEYLRPLLSSLNGAYAGSLQDAFEGYAPAYRHCRWLSENRPFQGEIVFFSEHAGAYLLEQIPGRELFEVFHLLAGQMEQDKLSSLLETGQALLNANFHFARAAESLFVHKNTIVYRYQALKSALQIDPVANASDREFLSMFCLYLRMRGKEGV